MGDVTEDDMDFAYNTCRGALDSTQVRDFRERIEARCAVRCDLKLAASCNAKDTRIAELEAQLAYERIDSEAWRDWAHRLTGFPKWSTDGGYRSGVDCKIAHLEAELNERDELREQRDAAESARDHAISFQAANVARCERLEDALEKAERKIEDAKPVLTAEEERYVAQARRYGWERLESSVIMPVLDRLCPTPKAPPTDAELAALLDVDPMSSVDAIAYAAYTARDALRARGGK